MEHLFYQIIDKASDAIIIVENRQIRFVNSSICDLTGYSKEELEKKSIFDLVFPEDKKILIENYNKVVTEFIHSKNFVFRIIHHNSDIRWMQAKMNYFVFQEKMLVVYYITDISERKQAEDAVTTNLNFLNTLIETIPNPLFYKNTKGEFIGCNQAFEDFLGYTKEELSGLTVFDIFPPLLAQKVTFYNKELLKTCNKKVYELKLPHSDGTLHDVILYNTVFFNPDKSVGGMVGIITDITRRKQTEIALQESEKKYRKLLNEAPLGIIAADLDGNIQYANQNVLDLLGSPSAEHTREINLLTFPSLIESKISENIKFCIENDEKITFEGVYESKWGKKIDFRIMVSPVQDVFNKKAGILLIVQDIREQKLNITKLQEAKEKAEEADKLKSVLVANVSHELRSPLNAILGFTELLQNDKLDSQLRTEYLNYIQNNGSVLMHLINDLIDAAKIEVGQINIEKENFYINSILNELFSVFSKTNKKNNVNLVLKIGCPSKDFLVYTDRHRLRQILTNLIVNAFKFTDSGKIEFGYIVEKTNLLFHVRDTGIGIPDEKLSSIFERFMQVEKSHKRNYTGTGLGLSITKTFIELLGGNIWVTSKLGEGSTFYFTLPYTKTIENQEVKTKMSETVVNYNWQGKTILIAEDAQMNFILLEKVLRKYNVEILWAKNGREAIELVESHLEINLVLMDMQMPVMDGYDAVPVVKKSKPNLPIIAQTAFAMQGEKEKIIALGCDDYVSKPIDKNDLLQKIDKFLSKV